MSMLNLEIFYKHWTRTRSYLTKIGGKAVDYSFSIQVASTAARCSCCSSAVQLVQQRGAAAVPAQVQLYFSGRVRTGWGG